MRSKLPPCYKKKVSTSDISEVESFVHEVENWSTNCDASIAKLIFDLGYNWCLYEVESSSHLVNFVHKARLFKKSFLVDLDASIAKQDFDLGYNWRVHEVGSFSQYGNFIDGVENFVENLAWKVRCRFWFPLGSVSTRSEAHPTPGVVVNDIRVTTASRFGAWGARSKGAVGAARLQTHLSNIFWKICCGSFTRNFHHRGEQKCITIRRGGGGCLQILTCIGRVTFPIAIPTSNIQGGRCTQFCEAVGAPSLQTYFGFSGARHLCLRALVAKMVGEIGGQEAAFCTFGGPAWYHEVLLWSNISACAFQRVGQVSQDQFVDACSLRCLGIRFLSTHVALHVWIACASASISVAICLERLWPQWLKRWWEIQIVPNWLSFKCWNDVVISLSLQLLVAIVLFILVFLSARIDIAERTEIER